jgi:hypothetical protein
MRRNKAKTISSIGRMYPINCTISSITFSDRREYYIYMFITKTEPKCNAAYLKKKTHQLNIVFEGGFSRPNFCSPLAFLDHSPGTAQAQLTLVLLRGYA